MKYSEICRLISLYFIDKTWSQYLNEIANIRDGIHLTRLGKQEPLFEYHKLAIEIFEKYRIDMESSKAQKFNSIDIHDKNIDMDSMGLKAPSSTWTYLVNDDPFEGMWAIHFAAEIGFSVGVFITWPLMLIFPLLKRLRMRCE